jgi:hypothetical protein
MFQPPPWDLPEDSPDLEEYMWAHLADWANGARGPLEHRDAFRFDPEVLTGAGVDLDAWRPALAAHGLQLVVQDSHAVISRVAGAAVSWLPPTLAEARGGA